MVNFEIIIFSLIIVSVLLALGFLIKRQEAAVLKFGGFIILLLTSIFFLISPVAFPSGEVVSTNFSYVNVSGSIVPNNSSTINSNVYVESSTTLNLALSLSLILASLWGIIETVRVLRSDKVARVEGEDDKDNKDKWD